MFPVGRVFFLDSKLISIFLAVQGRLEEAERLFERSQKIRVRTLGPEHPEVAKSLNNRAVLFGMQVRGTIK